MSKVAARTEPPAATSNIAWPDLFRNSAASSLAMWLALAAVPAAAQDAASVPSLPSTPAGNAAAAADAAPTEAPEPPATLEDLIPDAAVENPEDWATQGVPPEDAVPDDAPSEVDVDSSLAELPGLEVSWPDDLDLPMLAPLDPDPDIQFVEFDDGEPDVQLGSEERLSDELALVFPTDTALFPRRDEFVDRFNALSTIRNLDADGNTARLGAQATEDEELLNRLLRTYGYYDGQVIRSVQAVAPGQDSADEQPSVRFDILPGSLYHFGAIELGQLSATGSDYPMLREAFGIETGDPLLQDSIVDEQGDLDTALGEGGYPFAEIDEPQLLVDHARREGDLEMPVMPGGKYRFGKVTSNMPEFLSSDHLNDIARFKAGDLYQRSLELDLRQAMLATGVVGSVELTPVEVSPPAEGEPGIVDIAAEITEGQPRTLAGSVGYGTGEGFKLAGSWEHRNLFPPEGALRVRGIAGTREQLLGVTLRKSNFGGRDRILSVDVFASTIDYFAYEARTVSLVSTFEQVSTLLYQKPLSWSGGLELVATQEQERLSDGSLGPRRTYFVGALPLYAQRDTSDDLLDPSEGYRLGVRLSPETSRTDGVQSFYLRSQVDASYYQQVTENVVIAGRARFGSIPGAPVSAIAPSRRLYAGGGGSVRGYGYRAIGPQNSEGDPTGGRSLTELSLEARIRTGLLDGALGVVPFVDAGTVGRGSAPGFDEIKVGAGIGLRYYTSFGPMRIDVATPINPGRDDGPIAVYVALGQTF